MTPSELRRWSAIGLAGVVAAFVGLGALYATTVPKFLPADETAHVGYALVLGTGELPRLDTEVPDEVPGLALQYEVRREIYTANHPPLFYVAAAVPLRLGVWTGHPVAGFVGARLLTVALTAAAALAVWWTTRLLLPARPEAAVLAAAATLLLPAVPRFAGVVYNDGFTLAVAAWALLATVRALVLGPSRGRAAAVVVAAVALTLTRAVGIPAAGLVAAGAAVAVLLHDTRPTKARVVRAGGLAALVGAAGFVASGWFWLRSRSLYGDIAGSAYNLRRFEYGPRGSTTELLRDSSWALTLARQLWGRVYDNAEYTVGRWALPGLLLVALVVAGTIVLAARAARRRPRPGRATWGAWEPAERGRAVAWLLLVAWSGLLYVSTISYIASGGGVHGRYLLPGWPAMALLATAALVALPGRRVAVAPVLTVVVLVATGVQWAARFADLLRPDASWWGAAMAATATEANGVPAVTVALALLSTAAGGVVASVALVRLARPAAGADPPGP
ncbi:MAG: hypothetical protein KDB10_04850 [Acidimicrobiales bacterium]|nr:hypothetical protein [Acidimicrobiales bacterium]